MISLKEICEAGRDWVADYDFDERDTLRSVYLAGFRAGALWAQDFILEKLNNK